MLASSFGQHVDHVVPMPSNLKGEGVLRTAAIYGANASGKTKMIDALSCLQKIVSRTRSPNSALPVVPFKLAKQEKNSSCRFDIQFLADEKVFHYGIVVSDDGKIIQEEWLFTLTGKRQTRCFERVSTLSSTKVLIGPGFAKKDSKEHQKLDLIADATNVNQPFVTKAWENKSKVAASVVNWFRRQLLIIGADANYQPLEVHNADDQEFSVFLGDYLDYAGTGIREIRTQSRPVDLDVKFKDITPAQREAIARDVINNDTRVVFSPSGSVSKISKNENGEIVEYMLQAGHLDADGRSTYFDFREESHGTQRLAHLIPTLYFGKKNQKVIVVDELDRKLHPLLTKRFVEDFIEMTKEKSSQLIFTTHDTNLLDQDILRRDEIWFAEKDCISGASIIFPLTDFEVRADLKIDKGYLNGRFGGIPFFGNCKLP